MLNGLLHYTVILARIENHVEANLTEQISSFILNTINNVDFILDSDRAFGLNSVILDATISEDDRTYQVKFILTGTLRSHLVGSLEGGINVVKAFLKALLEVDYLASENVNSSIRGKYWAVKIRNVVFNPHVSTLVVSGEIAVLGVGAGGILIKIFKLFGSEMSGIVVLLGIVKLNRAGRFGENKNAYNSADILCWVECIYEVKDDIYNSADIFCCVVFICVTEIICCLFGGKIDGFSKTDILCYVCETENFCYASLLGESTCYAPGGFASTERGLYCCNLFYTNNRLGPTTQACDWSAMAADSALNWYKGFEGGSIAQCFLCQVLWSNQISDWPASSASYPLVGQNYFCINNNSY